jgi:hypothetical protein
MNTDDIIRMARAAGLCDEDGRDSDSIVITGYLERFAALVAAAEREACAKLLDEMAAADKLSNYYQVAALRIRERGAP